MTREPSTNRPDPIRAQEMLYRLPYHWFPEERLKKFERQEKQRIIFDLLARFAPETLDGYLDVGCGDGRWTFDVRQRLPASCRAVGVDFSERAIGFARLIAPEIEFQVQRGESLPFEDSTFDFLTSIEVIEHVEDGSEETFLSELYRVLRPDGLMILTTPSWNLKLTQHHFRHYSVERLADLVEEAGFEMLQMRGQSIPCYGRPRWVRKRMNLFPVIWKLWRATYREVAPEKSLNLILAARKPA